MKFAFALITLLSATHFTQESDDIIFRVRVGSFNQKANADSAEIICASNGTIHRFEKADSLIVIEVGSYSCFKEAEKTKELIIKSKSKFVKDAWVISYRNKKNILVADAIEATKKCCHD